jgi:hypothetical protein
MTTGVLRFTYLSLTVAGLACAALGCKGSSSPGSKGDSSSTPPGSSHPGGSGPHEGGSGDEDSGVAQPDGAAGSMGAAGGGTPSGSAGQDALNAGAGGSTGAAGTSAGAAAGSGAGGAAAGAAGSAGMAPGYVFTELPDSTYLSDHDRSVDGVILSLDRLSGEWLGLGTWGVRSTRAIAPHQGVFYFEATLDPGVDYFDMGIATASAALERPAGSTPDGFSVDNQGYFAVNNNVTLFSAEGSTFGFVVDYRGAHPTVHVFDGKGTSATLVTSQTIDTISAPVFIHLSGLRRVAGPQVTINAGNDTTNRPFNFDPVAALNAAGLADTASALVLGWGATHSATHNAAPIINVAPVSPASIAVGASVTLTATATDPEDGPLTANIAWDVLSEGNGPERVHGSGGSFTFTPNVLGKHPILASVMDSYGNSTRAAVVTVEATGTLQQFTDVRLTLEAGLSGDGIMVSPNGLQAHWTLDAKNGVRANQALYHGFGYVEGHRLVAESNQAIGLVIGNVSLNPYHFDITPPSCSVNTVGPGVYQDLILVESYSMANTEYYGLAVDYRGDSPIVYVIMNGKLTNTLHLTDVTVPIYPMLYGNVTGLGAAYDMEINFGATAFHEDPAAVLAAANIDATGLSLCWGGKNQNCLHR